ncbi:MAG: hybrid sensor histidine kinase/response regulator [Candidatus Eremiobacteraeota bacterium]|nr:hybrid sensor histidine kinase/response regulator [Candidatus Eremiobacteraeota bacterium]
MVDLKALKRELLSVLAHDIKGPLTSIIGFAELLEEGFVEGEGAIDAARTIRTNAQRLSTLAGGVLALARSEPDDLELADERVDIAGILEALAGAYGESHPLAVRAESPAYVRGDRERLREALGYVIDNAVKYSLGNEPVDIAVAAGAGCITVTVRDRGIGVPPEDAIRIFERFARGSNVRRAKIAGSGAGLFLARTIVERHGGTLSFERCEPGTAFTVVLPAHGSHASGPSERVTIVTADSTLRRFVAQELRGRNYRVREAASVEELSGSHEMHSGDIVLIDGWSEPPQTLRETIASVPVRAVAIAGDGNADGWDATLPKPFLIDELLAVISANGK